MQREDILGSWRLVSFVYKSDDDGSFYPYGKEAEGFIIYEASGYMAALITRIDRPSLSTEDFGLLSNSEKIGLAKGFMAYAGSYEILEDTILHHIGIGYFPNWARTTFVRYASVESDVLTLTTPPVSLRDKVYKGFLVWQKIRLVS